MDYAEQARVTPNLTAQRIVQAQMPATGSGNQALRPLDAVAMAADRVEGITAVVDGFVQRFHGGGLMETSQSNSPAPPAGYGGQISRLSAALDRLGDSVRTLGEIG
jgi:hypothetical protein